MLGIALEPHPAGFDIAAISLAETGRGAHHAVFEDATGAVGGLVQGIELGRGKPRRLGEDRIGDIGGAAVERRHRVDHKAHLVDRGGVGHRLLSKLTCHPESRDPLIRF